MAYYGAIEAGGTKFVCAVSDDQLNIQERVSFPTEMPEKTLANVIEFFKKYEVKSIGVGSFGPIDVNENSKTYGYVTNTPKEGWRNYDFLGKLKENFDLPMAWTTDVNAAAFGELKRGAAQGLESCIYLTVGTGIGGGAVVNGKILSGYSHPEMGHILIKRHPDDSYVGTCPYHKDCLEGLAAGPSIEARTETKGQDLTPDNAIWKLEAYYLAQAAVNYTLTLSPERIIFGGGVMKQTQLFDLMRASFIEQMAEYVQTPDLSEYLVPCDLEDNAGITGCLLLAMDL